MTKDDREALFLRLAKISGYDAMDMSDVMAFVVREVDRAVRRERRRAMAEFSSDHARWGSARERFDEMVRENAKLIEGNLQEAEQLEFKRSKGER